MKGCIPWQSQPTVHHQAVVRLQTTMLTQHSQLQPIPSHSLRVCWQHWFMMLIIQEWATARLSRRKRALLLRITTRASVNNIPWTLGGSKWNIGTSRRRCSLRTTTASSVPGSKHFFVSMFPIFIFPVSWWTQKYKDLRACIYATQSELNRFRKIVVNTAMATDIMDKNLLNSRKERWEKAFASADRTKMSKANSRRARDAKNNLRAPSS